MVARQRPAEKGDPIEFRVEGEAAPQGSKNFVGVNKNTGRGIMVESSKKLKPWRDLVAKEARLVAPDKPMSGPVSVEIEFRFPMPKSRAAANRKRGWCWRTVTPDVDKLSRAIFDAMKDGGIIKDDSVVSSLKATKIETPEGWHGAHIRVSSLSYK